MVGVALVLVGLFGAQSLWLISIRRYVLRSGETPITGANWGVTSWADWQTCRDYARAHRDARGLRLARMFIVWHVVAAIGFMLILFKI